jgi:predicted GNAT family acetyltransferase
MDWDSKVTNNTDAKRFEIEHEGHQAIAQYLLGDGSITFIHTFVPPKLRGQGVAGALARVALAFARREGLKVVPACAYFESYMKGHPETRDLLA